MTVYIDTSVCVSLFIDDVHSARVKAWFRTDPEVALSRWTMAEFSSALARLRRQAIINGQQHESAEMAFDQWVNFLGPPIALTDGALIHVGDLCRENGAIRTPDAVHIVLSSHARLPLATLDNLQSGVAKRYGVDVIDL